MAQLLVHRKAYRRKDGTPVRATSFYIRDRGHPGRTPESKKFFEPKRRLAVRGIGEWHAASSAGSRRKVLRALVKRRGYATVVRELNALRNVSTDREVDQATAADMNYLQLKYRKE